MRALILGCGPAGLAAAHAAISSGYEVTIHSKRQKPSTQYGCQYLHAPIPGYENVSCVLVNYELNGTPEEYRAKVYGSDWQGRVSPEDFIGEHKAWDIRETYLRMWDDLITSGRVKLLEGMAAEGSIPGLWIIPDKVISSIPAKALCYQEHEFSSRSIWVNGSIKEIPSARNSIICDGTTDNKWYRISNVFGYLTTEWPSKPKDHIPAVRVDKPLSTDCDCYPSIIRVGRYGSWDKSYLVHQVYPAVMEALK